MTPEEIDTFKVDLRDATIKLMVGIDQKRPVTLTPDQCSAIILGIKAVMPRKA